MLNARPVSGNSSANGRRSFTAGNQRLNEAASGTAQTTKPAGSAIASLDVGRQFADPWYGTIEERLRQGPYQTSSFHSRDGR